MRRNNLLHLLDDPVLNSKILKHSLYHYISFIKTLMRKRGEKGRGREEKVRQGGDKKEGIGDWRIFFFINWTNLIINLCWEVGHGPVSFKARHSLLLNTTIKPINTQWIQSDTGNRYILLLIHNLYCTCTCTGGVCDDNVCTCVCVCLRTPCISVDILLIVLPHLYP